jgi:hypothetical protein
MNFGNPKIATANNSPNRKALLVRLDESTFLNVAPAADSLAGLRIIKDSVLAVYLMFGIEIVRVRSVPMALQGQPHGSIIHLHLPPYDGPQQDSRTFFVVWVSAAQK